MATLNRSTKSGSEWENNQNTCLVMYGEGAGNLDLLDGVTGEASKLNELKFIIHRGPSVDSKYMSPSVKGK